MVYDNEEAINALAAPRLETDMEPSISVFLRKDRLPVYLWKLRREAV